MSQTLSPRPIHQYTCSSGYLLDMILNFTHWLEKVGHASYDPYDIWGTCFGKKARKLYYAKNPLGAALTAPLIVMEMICPSLRQLFVKKERFATADAQLILGFLNLHTVTMKAETKTRAKSELIANSESVKDTDNKAHLSSRIYQHSQDWLIKAKELAEDLLGYSAHGYSGYCWGYPFDWQHTGGHTPRGTPLITATPYCFEAFLSLYDATGESRYLEIARSIATFVFEDLNDTPLGGDAAAGSYTPYDHGKVVNASAYRAFVLFEAARRFGLDSYADKAWMNLRFILQSQRPDGSWLYAIDTPGEAFIDHFHTCFVLKNLHKINEHLMDSRVRKAIVDGYRFYRQELFNHRGLPKSFAIQPRMQISWLEMYNVAEAINLGALLRDYIPESYAMAQQLAYLSQKRFQLRQGHFITRIYVGGLKHKFPFLRWPQAQIFYALTSLLATNCSNAA